MQKSGSESMTSSDNSSQIPLERFDARAAYRNDTVAAKYEKARFSSWRGRVGDWLDKRVLRLALRHLPQESLMVLDVPCGTGRMTSTLITAGYRVVACDVSAEMMAIARHRLVDSSTAPLGYVQADALRLPFQDKVFVCATAMRFMGHVPPAARIQVLRELSRVSRICIIADYCVHNPITRVRRWFERLIATRDFGFERSWAWQIVSRRELEREFRAAGLRAARWIPKVPFISDAWTVVLEPEGGQNQEK